VKAGYAGWWTQTEKLFRHDSLDVADERVERRVSDGRVADLVKRVSEPEGDGRDAGMDARRRESAGGDYVSPLLSNIYLDPLDHHMFREDMKWCDTPDDF